MVARKVTPTPAPRKVVKRTNMTTVHPVTATVAKEVGVSDHKNLIPAKTYADSYIGRVVQGTKDLDILRFARKMKMNTLIYGPTGPGKTSFTMAYAAEDRLPFYSVSCTVGMDPTDLFGKYNPTDKAGQAVWQDGPVTSMVRHGGVLLINEVNFMPARIGSVLFSLLDKRRQIQLTAHKGEVITAHPDFQIIADMNPGYEGTRDLNAAFKNRFAIQLNWDYDLNVEQKLVKSKELLKFAGKLRVAAKDGTISTPCSTNMLMEYETIREELGANFAAANLLASFDAFELDAVQKFWDLSKSEIEKSYRSDAQVKAEEAALKKAAADKAKAERNQFADAFGPDGTLIDKSNVDQTARSFKGNVAADDEDYGVEGVDYVWEEVDDEDTDDDEDEDA